ncbi:glycosyltransferase family 1 protein [Marinilactibacillus psychrotolerans]|uniref:Glycosyltransferase family 1 protein n=1 Tax=Marinilactibacillus psychrotolerans TaxID=191770 RepID=A0A5R9C0R4_9LACT|nr:glycosyltransferase family 1 protein [Marinilactibacillus psychrotolerans]
MIRVLHFQGRMGLGGAETFMMNTYRNIDRSKIQFDFLLYDDFKDVTPYNEEIKKLGGRIYYVPNPKKNIIKYVTSVSRLLKDHQFDIVHSQVFFGGGLNVWLAKRAGIKKRIVHSHATSHEKEQNIVFKKVRAFLDQLMFKYTTDYLACSYDAGYALFGHNHDFTFIPNGIDIDKYQNIEESKNVIRNSLGIDGDTLVLGNIGRLEKQKNHSFLIEVFSKVKSKESDAILLLIGEGSLEQELKTLVEVKQLTDSVHFLGVRQDIPRMLKAMDIFIMPSLYEGLPISAVEAQAAGKKVVLSTEVSKETQLTDNVSFLSLDESIERWAERTIQHPYQSHPLPTLELYDMNNTAIMMEKIYLNGSK